MKLNSKIRKKFRIRNKLKRVSKVDRFRLSISRSSKNISAQIIDDINNVTLVSATSNEKLIKSEKKRSPNYQWLLQKKLQKKQKRKI